MKVKVFPAFANACGYYRMQLPAKTLIEQGADVEVFPKGTTLPVHRNATGAVVGAVDPECDVIVLQAIASSEAAAYIPMVQRLGVAVVIDLDDDMARLPVGHPNHRASLPNANPGIRYLRECCRLADAVTCSTPSLLESYGFGHGHLVRNTIDVLTICPSEDVGTGEHVVGWSGNLDSHRGDLDVVGDGIRKAMDGTGWHGLSFGSAGIMEALRITGEDLATWFPVETEDGAYQFMLGRFGVGLAPLKLSRFNNCRSFLRPLELAAAGVPCVASPTVEYRHAAKLGLVAAIADGPNAWCREVRKLITNDDHRLTVAEQAHRVAGNWTIQRHTGTWWDVWNRAYERRAPRRALQSMI